MVGPGSIRLDVLGEFITTCPCFDLIGSPTTDSSGWRIHGSIRPAHASTNAPTTPSPSPLVHPQYSYKSTVQSTNQSIIFPSIQCEQNTSIMLFMFLLLTCLFLLDWCFKNWLFWFGVDGVHWPAKPVRRPMHQQVPHPVNQRVHRSLYRPVHRQDHLCVIQCTNKSPTQSTN